MKKTAKQMFEELGWEIDSIQYNCCYSDVKIEVNNCVIKNFIEYRSKDFDRIYFDLDTQMIHYAFNGNRDSFCMRLDFIQAINQAIIKQAEELDWGKEEKK